MRLPGKIEACGLLIVALSSPLAAAHGFFSVGINLGAPVYYRPWYPCYGYYRPYPVVVAAPPVVVAPVQPVTVVQPTCAAAPAPATVTTSAPPLAEPNGGEIQRQLALLSNPDDNLRSESALQLGRLRAYQAVDPLAASLAGDRSPAVREAAARALGLIGSAQALPALQRAAQLDSDREVRHSAQFALEVIQTRG